VLKRQQAVQKIRQKLCQKHASVGSWMQIPDTSIAEIMGQAGYDWVALDLEHGSISIHQLPDLFRALELGGTLPLVRVAQGAPKDCKQALDAGAGGIIIPMVESAEQLKTIRDACRWPPAGVRGVGFSRANLFGEYFQDYTEEAQAPLIIAMIEHVKAVDNLKAILAVEGVDAIFIGPYDLSASMNITGRFDQREFKEKLNYIHNCAKEAGVACGIHVVGCDKQLLNQYIAEDYLLIAYSMDAIFLRTNVANPLGTVGN
jgi:2-dehydro-3-deoxyglucarate aldolase